MTLADVSARTRRRLALMLSLRRERRALATLQPHLLRDVGLLRAAAAREARRPCWSLPENRRE